MELVMSVITIILGVGLAIIVAVSKRYSVEYVAHATNSLMSNCDYLSL